MQVRATIPIRRPVGLEEMPLLGGGPDEGLEPDGEVLGEAGDVGPP